MTALLASQTLSDRMAGIRDHFVEGSPWGELIAVVLGLVACLLLLALGYHVHHTVRRREHDHPGRLFGALVAGLGLTAAQRQVLRRMAHDLRLEHPAVLLLSPRLWRDHTARWAQAHPHAASGDLAGIERILFEAAGKDRVAPPDDAPVESAAKSEPSAASNRPAEPRLSAHCG